MKFKVKRHWWMWAGGILFHILAIIMAVRGAQWIFMLLFFVDIFVVFPDMHLSYTIAQRQLIIKRILFPEIEIPCDKIQTIEFYSSTMFGGFGIKIIENVNPATAALRFTYSKPNGRHYGIIISAKERDNFMNELSKYIAKEVILFNNTESAFKTKKDINVQGDDDKLTK